MSSADELSDLQRDALMETFNVGVGRACRSLSQLLGCEAAISVPTIVTVNAGQSSALVDAALRSRDDVCMAAVPLMGIDAEAVIIIQGARETVSAMLSVRSAGSDLREGVTCKIATLMGTSCAGQIEDLLFEAVGCGDPVFHAHVPEQVFSQARAAQEALVILKIDMALKKRGVNAYLLLSFTRTAAQKLADGLDNLMQQM